MKVIGFIGAVFTFVFFANLAYAADMSIDMLNKDADGNRMVYSNELAKVAVCLLYTSPSPRDGRISRMPSSA